MRRMNQRILHFLIICLVFLSAYFVCGREACAQSYMSDKTEIPVNLEVSGAEALCQTADGYVWIAQYSGLTRYDSKEFVTYKNFEYDGNEYNILWTKSPSARSVTPVSYESQQCVLVSRAAFRLQCLCTAFRYIIKAPAGQLPTHPTSAAQECNSCKDDYSR